MRAQPVPEVLRLADGQSVLPRGQFCYEAHQVADGVDLYRDAVSGSPYASLGHAYAAGAAPARLHLAAADFGLLAARPVGLPTNSCQVVIGAADPLAMASRLPPARPALTATRPDGPRPADFRDAARFRRSGTPRRCWPPCPRSGGTATGTRPTSPGPRPRRTPGWPGSSTSGWPTGLIAVHDLALALERAVVSWLDLPETGTATADLAVAAVILDGYQTVRPLSDAEAAALPRLLPVVHLEYALSEVGLLHQRGGLRRPTPTWPMST